MLITNSDCMSFEKQQHILQNNCPEYLHTALSTVSSEKQARTESYASLARTSQGEVWMSL